MKLRFVHVLAAVLVVPVAIVSLGLAPIDTGTYASGYSEAGFKAISQGMTLNEVTKLLGPPLYRTKEHRPKSTWVFAIPSDITLGQVSDCSNVPRYRCWWVQFDEKERVSESFGQVPSDRLIGLTQAEMIARFGTPSMRLDNVVASLIYGAHPNARFGYARIRVVDVNQNDHVVAKWAYVDWD